jgi:hypothetical protein
MQWQHDQPGSVRNRLALPHRPPDLRSPRQEDQGVAKVFIVEQQLYRSLHLHV